MDLHDSSKYDTIPVSPFGVASNSPDQSRKITQRHESRNKYLDNQEEQSYLLLKRWPMSVQQKITIMTVFLILSVFFERFFFIIIVYKTKFFGYLLILFVIALNTVFHFVNQRLRRKKHKFRLHEMFNIERTPKIGICLIGFIGCLDMLYAFFLFWPANVMNMYMIVVLMQLFIPLSVFMRTCCAQLKHYPVHLISALVILIGVVFSLLDLMQPDE